MIHLEKQMKKNSIKNSLLFVKVLLKNTQKILSYLLIMFKRKPLKQWKGNKKDKQKNLKRKNSSKRN
jgi:hypothetical protein